MFKLTGGDQLILAFLVLVLAMIAEFIQPQNPDWSKLVWAGIGILARALSSRETDGGHTTNNIAHDLNIAATDKGVSANG